MITVVIPVYNGERFLAEAIESVLNQGLPVELVVLNDGSTDGTEDVVKEYGEKIRYLSHPNRGYIATRNRGIEMGQGTSYAFVDADDIWPENRLKTLLQAMDAETDIVVGRVSRMVPDKAGGYRVLDEAQQAMSLGAALFKREVFEKIGLLDDSLEHHDDIEFFLRAQTRGLRIKKLEDVTLYYRRHEENMTNDEEAVQATLPSALHRIIQMRRAQKRAGGRGQP